MSLDLDINNYGIEELVNIFKIPILFTSSDLQKAKKMVLRSHPDKSGLDKEYFLFFSDAYKILYKIYTYRNGGGGDNNNHDNDNNDNVDNNNKNMLKTKFNNQRFNEIFEKNKVILDEDVGYGYEDWYSGSGSEDCDRFIGLSWSASEVELEKQKKRLKEQYALISSDELQGVGNGNMKSSYYNLGQGKAQDHSFNSHGGCGGGLQYKYLKLAHTMSVIPITAGAGEERHESLNELKMNRDASLKEYNYSSTTNTNSAAQEEDIARVYRLMKQDEALQEMNKKCKGAFFNMLLDK